MKDVNLNSLKIFLVVATSNSFLEASNKLYISQPAISKSINKLEEDLGVSLFYRANKGVTLTSDGEILLKYVKDSRKLLLACERMLSSNNSLDSGSIVIGAQSHIVRNYLLEKINNFRKLFPNVMFRIVDLSTLELIEGLEKHELDFVVDASPINTPYNNLRIQPIYKLDTCFIKSKENNKVYNKITDLEDECIVMPISRSSLRKNLFKSLENVIDIKPQLEYGTEELIIESVKRNMGIGYVVKGETLKIDKNTIDIIDLNIPLPTVEINLVYIDSYLTPLAREFITKEFDVKEVATNE
ncbi:MAG: LysR family transcriptional regulator [Mollicutes bacterium]|nr:LysR family transcriptional regulator [Mollicutes bacterium]